MDFQYFVFLLLAVATAIERSLEYLIKPITKRVFKEDAELVTLTVRTASVVLAFLAAYIIVQSGYLPTQFSRVHPFLLMFILTMTLPFGTEGVHDMLRLVQAGKDNQEASAIQKTEH